MIILGSTGSIGQNALEIAKKFNVKIEAITANKNTALLNKQIEKFYPNDVCIIDSELESEIIHTSVYSGIDGIKKIIEKSSSGLILNAISGFSGLMPTIKALECQKEVALANKESLVVAGKFIDITKIRPIDSEHFGLKFLLNDKKANKLTITASGGALRDFPLEKMAQAKPFQVLNHPNWKMGKRITIDSATMVNKLFEVLEAKWLFGIENIEAIIEPKSMIHAFVEFVDGSTTAHFAKSDMKLPIAYAILGKVDEPILEPVNLLDIAHLEFKEIDTNRYPLWNLKDTLLANPDLGLVLNAADEIAVSKFLNEEIDFFGIYNIIENAMQKFSDIKINEIEDIFKLDEEVRAYCQHLE